mgnify:CR=1 FL=1
MLKTFLFSIFVTVMNAEAIKTILIDFLISQNDSIILGSEVTYGSKKQVVKISAFEIKADRDDVRRLDNQINEYKKIFDYIYVVCTKKQLYKVQEKTDKTIGIFLIDDEERINIKRKALRQRNADKRSILETVNANYLKRTFNLNRRVTANEARDLLTNKNAKELKNTLYTYLETFLSKKFSLFLSEKGINTHIDDLPVLSIHRRDIIL